MKIFKKTKLNRGMTYVELIVVLSIFAIMSSIAIFNYGDFQANVDIKNLTSDIALQIVQAQKASLNGVIPPGGAPSTDWKPSYGVYFNLTNPGQFVYFVDKDNNGYNVGGSEDLNVVQIQKGDTISRIEKCTSSACLSGGSSNVFDSISIYFKRPDSGTSFKTSPSTSVTGSEYVRITVKSPRGKTGFIEVYPSGRIQVN